MYDGNGQICARCSSYNCIHLGRDRENAESQLFHKDNIDSYECLFTFRLSLVSFLLSTFSWFSFSFSSHLILILIIIVAIIIIIIILVVCVCVLRLGPLSR